MSRPMWGSLDVDYYGREMGWEQEQELGPVLGQAPMPMKAWKRGGLGVGFVVWIVELAWLEGR